MGLDLAALICSINIFTMNKTFFGHPAGLFTLFFTEMWERFSYYGMRAILMLFMVANIGKENGGLGFTEENAGAIYGLYTASVYLLTLPGGWLADNVFGQRKSIWYPNPETIPEIGGSKILWGLPIILQPMLGKSSPKKNFTTLEIILLK